MGVLVDNKIDIRKGKAHHIVLEGSAYEVGRMQGEFIKARPEYLKFMTSFDKEDRDELKRKADEVIKFFDRYCPNINDEIKGFADSVGVPVNEIAYYIWTYSSTSNCSQMAVFPSGTEDNHLLVGRSYEWSYDSDSDIILITTRVNGQAAHIGFSLVFFGRTDGINEHGLCVTMTNGVPGALPKENGFRFWAVIRTILDRCKNVEEAVELVNNMPISFNWILLLADRSGQAAIIELTPSRKAVKRIDQNSKESYLFSTNHYNLPEMLQYDTNRMRQSVMRYRAIEENIEANIPKINKGTIRKVLAKHMPEGVSCHYYKDGLGTLWSMIFDVTKVNVDICFGSPVTNSWSRFDLRSPAGITEYDIKIPYESSKLKIWERLSPGTEI